MDGCLSTKAAVSPAASTAVLSIRVTSTMSRAVHVREGVAAGSVAGRTSAKSVACAAVAVTASARLAAVSWRRWPPPIGRMVLPALGDLQRGEAADGVGVGRVVADRQRDRTVVERRIA